jgi:Flp pilus assembly CpaE family ATPase
MLHYPLEKCHVVLNRADTKVGLKKDQVESALGKSIRFGIPSNKAVPTAINRGVPVVMTDPKADVTRAIRELCVAFSPEATAAAEQQGSQVKLSRRDRKRLADETQRAQLRDAEFAGGSAPAAAAPHSQDLELEFEFGDEAAA